MRIYKYDSFFEIIKFPLFILIAYSLCINFKKERYKLIIFAHGYCISLLLTILFFNTYVVSGNRYTGYVNRMAGTFSNPNSFANFTILGIYMSLFIIFYENSHKAKKVIGIMYFLAFIYALILSGSRGAMIGLFIGIGALIFRMNSSVIKRKYIIGLIVLLLIFLIIKFNDISIYLSRFLDKSSMASIYNNERFIIWRSFLRNMDKYIFFGIDYGGMLELNTLTAHSTAHNTYLSIFVRFGIIGAISFLGLIFSSFKIAKLKDNKIENNSYFYCIIRSMLITLMIISIFIDALNIRSYWIMLMLPYTIKEVKA